MAFWYILDNFSLTRPQDSNTFFSFLWPILDRKFQISASFSTLCPVNLLNINWDRGVVEILNEGDINNNIASFQAVHA